MSTAGAIGINLNATNNNFTPHDMQLKDDAFRSSNQINYLEWWYFDAIFDNGYSASSLIMIIGLANEDLVNVVINIYKDGEKQFQENKFYPLSKLLASETEPKVIVNGKQLMRGFLDKTKDQIIYNLTLKIDKTKLNLRFINNTKGWQGQTLVSSWGVMIPNSQVSGYIELDGKKMAVKGMGYHDHNWDFSLESLKNFRWYWGKTNSDSYSIVWSDILDKNNDNTIVVINEKNNGYFNILPEDVKFTASNYSENNGIEIPYTFEIKAEKENLFLDVKFETIKIHYVSYLNIIRYWRYYLNCTGMIKINDHEEQINQNNFAEFMRLVDVKNNNRYLNRFNGLLRCLLAQTGTSYNPGDINLFSSFRNALSSVFPHFLHLKP
jgi:hypothetical protein